VIDLFSERRLNHHTQVQSGVLADDCAKVCAIFLAERRELYRQRRGGPVDTASTRSRFHRRGPRN